MIHLLLPLLASAAAVAVQPGPFEVEAPPGSLVPVTVQVLPSGPLEVEGPGEASLRPPGGEWSRWRNLPATLPIRADAPHSLRFLVRVPEEPATLWFQILDAEGGVLLPIRIAPAHGPPPPVPESAPDPGPAPAGPPPAPPPPGSAGAPPAPFPPGPARPATAPTQGPAPASGEAAGGSERSWLREIPAAGAWGALLAALSRRKG